jgi:7-cyano-7-deazaguanine tRNA-ribosyltransferase
LRRGKRRSRVNLGMEYFDAREYDLAGRIGRLKTNHGTIETPYLFPVVDPTRQEPPLNTLERLGFNAFITNAYLFYRRNRGVPRSIHEALNWNKTIMTDSGGYQVLVYGDVDIDNKGIVSYEKMIGVDIGVILDIPTGTKMTWGEARRAVEVTFERAAEALPWLMDSEQLWVLPIQGAPYVDLIAYSSLRAWRYPYHIHAFGSPTVFLERYDYAKIVELVAIAKMLLPPHKPLHVFGVGHPMIIPFLVAVGGDLFDSASYILYARDDRYMVEYGTKRLSELSYLPCACEVCSKYTVRELLEMPRQERIRLLALHNLLMLKAELQRTKQAIREGRLWEYLEYKSKSHPSLREAFYTVKKYRGLMEKYNPLSNKGSFAMLLIDKDSLHNPRLEATRQNTAEYLLVKYRGRI